MVIRPETYFFIIVILTAVNGQRRIYGGKVVKEGQIPYAVYVETEGIGSCTGSIIHKDWVLSAAHCVTYRNTLNLVSYKKVKVTAGVVDFMATSQAQVRNAKNILRHEGYKSAVGKHDLSLINVEKGFSFDTNVRKIEFMTSPWPQNDDNTYKNCVSAGWGLTEDGKTTKIRYLNTTSKHGKNACPCIEKFYKLKRIVCLTPEADEGICFGDSGGALVCDGKVVGVAHVVIDKRTCSYFKRPDNKISCQNRFVYGVYMYTCPYLSWISASVPEIPSTPASCTGNTFCSSTSSIIATVFSTCTILRLPITTFPIKMRG